MQGANWSSSTTTVNLEMLSPKQLIGECLDMAAVVLREVSEIYCQNTKTELPANSVRCPPPRKTTSRSSSPSSSTPPASTASWKVPPLPLRLRDCGCAVEEAVHQDLGERAAEHPECLGALGTLEPGLPTGQSRIRYPVSTVCSPGGQPAWGTVHEDRVLQEGTAHRHRQELPLRRAEALSDRHYYSKKAGDRLKGSYSKG